MASIDNHVQITITKDTATVDRRGFGVPGIFTYHTRFAELSREYGNLQEMVDDGFLVTDRAHQMASKIFSQNPRPSRVIVGRRTLAPTRKVKLTPKIPLLASTAYDIVINGETIPVATDDTPLVSELTLALAAAVDSGGEDVNATDNTTDVDIEAADAPGGAPTAGAMFGVSFDPKKWTIDDSTPDPGIATDYGLFRGDNDLFYGLVCDVLGGTEIEALAAAVEATKKIYLADSQDSDIIAVGSADIASTLKTSNLERTGVCYHPAAGADDFASGLEGKQLPTDPGSTTWKFKTLAVVATYALSTSEQSQADLKNVNTYQVVGGIAITAEGTVASGEFIDITRFIDWVESRSKEDVFRALAINPKIPYTDLGIQTIVNVQEGVLKEGARRGGIDPLGEQPISVTAPRASEVDANDKGLRVLPDILFAATLAGAIHKAIINGRLVL